MKSILVVEDDDNDIFLVQRACQRSGLPHTLHVAKSGLEAVAYLDGNGKYADRDVHPLPQVVFLDVNMPQMDGLAVLTWIRSQPRFVDLPVIMLTSTIDASDVQRAFSLGVNSYLRKGHDLNEFGQGMRVILKYWLELNIRAA